MTHDTRTPRQNQRLAEMLADRAGCSANAVARSARGLKALLSVDGVPEDPTLMLEHLHQAVDQLRAVMLELHDAAGRDPFLGRRVRGYAFGAATLLNDAMTSIGLIWSRTGPTGRRRLCAHADMDGEGMHWLAPGETCTVPGTAGRGAVS